jgi:D-alanyl-D-alanine carboxypeptidase (penicillin-binding protein 5/6)
LGRLAIALISCALSVSTTVIAETPQEVTAFVIMNAKTGRVLLQRASHQKLYPASTTKVALLAYVLSTPGIDLTQKVVVPSEAVKAVLDVEKSRDNFSKYPSYILEARGSSAGFKTGEIIYLKDALFGAMLPSGNDAANTLAYYWGNGSIETCIEQINHFVESLGCLNTRLLNPHGLHHPQHSSTAYDLALITRYGMQIPLFRQIVSTTSYTKERTNKQPAVTWQQTNKLLLKGPYYYDRATGVKTGSHSRAQNCLIATGETSDRSLIVVLLHCQDRKQMFVGAKKLLQRFLTEEKTQRVIVKKGPLQLKREIEGQLVPLSLLSSREAAVSFYPSEEPVIRAVVEWKDLKFPVEQGQEIGILRIIVDDEEVDGVSLLASEHRDITWHQRLLASQKFLKGHRGAVLAISFSFVVLIIFAVRTRRRTTRR